MAPQQANQILEFGDFELDVMRRVLVTRADGTPVDITGRVLDALIYLVERPGQLVQKKALIEALWPNVVVEDGNLSQTIHTLRRVLGEKAGERRYIATVSGRGYQFVAEVRTRRAQVESVAVGDQADRVDHDFQSAAAPAEVIPPVMIPSRRSRGLLAGSALAVLLILVALLVWRGREQRAPAPAPAPAPGAATLPATTVIAHRTIAVLPFVDMSAEQDQEHFADGLSEEILNLLAHANNLRVTARTSSFSFKGENVDIKTIAQRLGVAYVLEGSVRKSGDQLRITAQLIDAATSEHMWSETYDRDVHDIFGVQREIATAVAGALRVSLARTAPRPAETTSTEAYDHYLQGRFLYNRRSSGDILQALEHFKQAVQIDPEYGRAWSGLAGVYFVAPYEHIEIPNQRKKWAEAAERAVEFAPELAEAHIRLAQYDMSMNKMAAADAHFARAAVLDPEDPLVLSSQMSTAITEGHMDEAVETQKRVVAIDPLSASHRSNLGGLFLSVGRFAEAQAEFERTLELSPAHAPTMANIADVLLLQGRHEEALAVVTRLPLGLAREERLALISFARGDRQASDQILARLAALTKNPDFDTGLGIALAEVYAFREEPDRAFEWLDRAMPRSKRQLDMRPAWSVLEELQISPYLKPLHADPRWERYLTEIKSRLW